VVSLLPDIARGKCPKVSPFASGDDNREIQIDNMLSYRQYVGMSHLTDLILETFRLNGELLIAGDALVADLDLTSARWQVLGTVAMSPTSLPVAHIARNMGLSRQAVQRIVNELVDRKLLQFASNPHHQRAKLVLLTAKGKVTFEASMTRQRPWAEELASGISERDIVLALSVLRSLRTKLESHNTTEKTHVEEFA
jgi:DNA-binding MarR family transcriptional regulator